MLIIRIRTKQSVDRTWNHLRDEILSMFARVTLDCFN